MDTGQLIIRSARGVRCTAAVRYKLWGAIQCVRKIDAKRERRRERDGEMASERERKIKGSPRDTRDKGDI